MLSKNTLYVVGTPIGNLGDISARAIETLHEVDFIAAEDTRVTLKLLRHFNIEASIISYHEHNKHEKGREIVQRLLNGENCAIVTDAGMPAISDPGEDLVALCAEHGIKTVVVPGPSAVISALAISGLYTGRFCFEGFLSVKKTSRFAHLEQIKNDTRTLVFYEAPHKLVRTLQDMLDVLGERKISLVREITKLHEEVIRTSFSAALEMYAELSPRGEYVIVIEGAAVPKEDELTFDDIVNAAKKLMQTGCSITQASKEAAKLGKYKKSDIYKALL